MAIWKVAGHMAVAVALCAAPPAIGAEARIPKNVFAEAARPASAPRSVVVVVAQEELSANINAFGAQAALGGGVLGVLIDAKVGADRAKRAEGGITPMRLALMDFDADTLAVETTKASTAGLPWFNAKTPVFDRDPTDGAASARLDASDGQAAFFRYTYEMTPDFSGMCVTVHVAIANKAAVKAGAPEKRLSYKNLAYLQTVTSVVSLPNPGEKADNASRWAAGDGALAKRGLTAAFADAGALIPRALTLSPDDLKRLNAGKPKTVGIYRGKPADEIADGALLFNGGLLHVQTLGG